MSAPTSAAEPAAKARPPASVWRIVSPPLSVVVALLVGTVAAAGLDATGALSEDSIDAVLSFAISLLILVFGWLLLRSLPAHERRVTLALKHSRGGAVGLGVTVGIGAMILTASIFLGAMLVDDSVEDKLDEREEDLPDEAWQIALFVIGVVVLAPLGEELVFRGLMLRALARRMRFLWAAVVSGAVFGLMHLDQYFPFLWPRTLGLIATGVVLALLYHWRGYWSAVVAHATVNTIATIALFAQG